MSASDLPVRVRQLLERGVRMPHPASVWVAEEVDPARIDSQTTLHPGTRVLGARTSMGPSCELGAEAPMTVEDCQLGAGVELKGGYAAGAVFLDKASAGSGAHIRPGSLLEEEANVAHTVGLKQTILLPFVTTGSLVNFCDCLMAGGTSRKDHSEVGSSYIHFNFTPHQDKATASLIGDVPHGVLLNQRPIFLGGQGGLVGPARIAYGCVIPAGVVWRGDAPDRHHLLQPPAALGAGGPRPYRAGAYRDAQRVLRNNLLYLGNIRALLVWYDGARALFARAGYERSCWEGAREALKLVERERVQRLREWMDKLPASCEILRAAPGETAAREAIVQQSILSVQQGVLDWLSAVPKDPEIAAREAVLSALGRSGGGYVEAIRGLDEDARAAATHWLQAVVEATASAETMVKGV